MKRIKPQIIPPEVTLFNPGAAIVWFQIEAITWFKIFQICSERVRAYAKCPGAGAYLIVSTLEGA